MRPDLAFRIAWRVRRAAARRCDSDLIHGSLERPDRRQLYSRWVDVRGWAVADDGAVVVRVYGGSRLLREIVPDVPRPDIVAHATGRSATTHGFDVQVPLDTAPRRFWLRVIAASIANPAQARTLGVCLLTRATPGQRALPRAAYRDVWNAAAGSLTDAQFSVSGTTDAAELERSGLATADDVVREAGVTASDVVLEIGCGIGRVGARLAPRCGRWIGGDVSDEMLGHARRALAALTNVEFLRLNGSDLQGVGDACVDVVYCTGVFMHLDEWDRYRYVTEAFRVLKPGGRLYIDNFNLLSEEGWALFDALCHVDPVARPANISKSSTPEELHRYVDRAGFTGIRTRTGGLWVSVFATKPL
jgi:SAM-dependent methyltransferase